MKSLHVGRHTYERFLRNVRLNFDGCWIPLKKPNSTGYVSVRLPDKTMALLHRVFWVFHNGRNVRGDMELDHLCRVKACCNPGHLDEVTHAENVRRGMCSGAKWMRLEGHPRAKLTVSQAAEIKVDSRRHKTIAADYGVSKSTISHIKTGRAWVRK
jgi:hypothetical protein